MSAHHYSNRKYPESISKYIPAKEEVGLAASEKYRFRMY
jgi:hypothetical protein